ncbi:MAG: MlaC/ttg2D family ABC transporter substrate-binding protein, partial [Acetobacteraceae bacterium]
AELEFLEAILAGLATLAVPSQDRRRAFATIAVDGVARFALGRFWRVATPEQRKTYLKLFREYLVFNVTGRLHQHRGTNFALGRAEPMGGDIAVESKLRMPGNQPARLKWIVSFASGKPKIVDILAEGTSLRITQRSDYASVIVQHGGTSIEPLLTAMRGQIAKLKAESGT